MLDLLNSLSLETGAAIIAVAAAICAVAWAQVTTWQLRWGLAIGTPAIFANALYWSPEWLGANSDQAWSWSIIAIGVWFLAGALSSALVTHLLHKPVGNRNAAPHV